MSEIFLFLVEDLVILDRNEERGARNECGDSVKDGFTTHLQVVVRHHMEISSE